MLSPLSRVMQGLRRGLEWLAIPVYGVLILMIVADVILRGLFKMPIFGSSEMANFLLALSVGVGLSVTAMRGGHVRMDLFDEHMRRTLGERLHARLLHAVSMLGMLLFAGLVFLFAWESARFGDVTPVLHWPVAPVFFATAGLLFIAALLGKR